jgi:hypothetical protein
MCSLQYVTQVIFFVYVYACVVCVCIMRNAGRAESMHNAAGTFAHSPHGKLAVFPLAVRA